MSFEGQSSDGTWLDLYPELHQSYSEGRFPTATGANYRCSNYLRYELMKNFGLFVTESCEHFAEYVPWFIKSHRPDLIEKFQIPLDEYPKRCIEQMKDWKEKIRAYENAQSISVTKSHEYAAQIVNAIVTGEPIVIYSNFANQNYIPQSPQGAAVEVPCMVDSNGFKPTVVDDIPPQLIALMRTN